VRAQDIPEAPSSRLDLCDSVFKFGKRGGEKWPARTSVARTRSVHLHRKASFLLQLFFFSLFFVPSFFFTASETTACIVVFECVPAIPYAIGHVLVCVTNSLANLDEHQLHVDLKLACVRCLSWNGAGRGRARGSKRRMSEGIGAKKFWLNYRNC
jgi:hypothetical protein